MWLYTHWKGVDNLSIGAHLSVNNFFPHLWLTLEQVCSLLSRSTLRSEPKASTGQQEKTLGWLVGKYTK